MPTTVGPIPVPVLTDTPDVPRDLAAMANATPWGLIWRRNDANTTAPSTSAAYAAAPGWPGPNVNLKAGRSYKVTGVLGVLTAGAGNFCKGVLRLIRSGSDVMVEQYVAGAGVLGSFTIVTYYDVPADQEVSIELGYGVFFGGGNAQLRNDLVHPFVMVEDVGKAVAAA